MNPTLAASDLWTAVHRMMRQLLCLAGAATIAAIAGLARRERDELRVRVSSLEAMVRKVLLIEAAALTERRRSRRPAQTPASQTTNAPHKRAPVFCLTPPLARAPQHPARIRQLGPPVLVRDLWRDAEREARIARLRAAPRSAPYAQLANRIAALTRVAANPLAHARRLARLIARVESTVFDCIVWAPARHRPPDFQDIAFDQAGVRARAIERTHFVLRR